MAISNYKLNLITPRVWGHKLPRYSLAERKGGVVWRLRVSSFLLAYVEYVDVGEEQGVYMLRTSDSSVIIEHKTKESLERALTNRLESLKEQLTKGRIDR